MSHKEKVDPAYIERLKTWIRTRGVEYLDDPNITSVGIGYKETDEEGLTDQIAVQFTVEKKVVPEAIEALGSSMIPETITLEDGEEVPTDVLERTFKPAYLVTEYATGPRTRRQDPIVPGISVAHRALSAGTIGSIVYDQHTGEPYVLSNWHVLQGSSGSLGDDIVQPGPHDDNRISQNRLGRLVRSHLGHAGDCAIASIEDRRHNATIADLGVAVEEIGEAELGDRVVKSGRTTGVTYGIVTRIHTMVRLDYGGTVGEQDIGGFEIGPDTDHPAADGEISSGGDSGSAWLFRDDQGRTTQVMAGLHFAGEGRFDPQERALACYPRSVFKRLEISPVPPEQPFDDAPQQRRGYDPDFLSHRVDLPTLTEQGRQHAYRRGGSEVVHYTHFSLALHRRRRFAMWVAWNIDGGRIRRISRRGIDFRVDPDIPSRYQIDNDLYVHNPLDRGHIARRADLCWGGEQEAREANRDSFFFTNIAPQMDDFNQSSRRGVWGQLENAVFADVDVEDLRVSVFGGPIFRADDRMYRGVRIPREYYKVIVFGENGVLHARAFLLTQNLDELEVLDLDEFRVYQVTLAEIEERCEFLFPEVLHGTDGFAELLDAHPEALEARNALESIGDIFWM